MCYCPSNMLVCYQPEEAKNDPFKDKRSFSTHPQCEIPISLRFILIPDPEIPHFRCSQCFLWLLVLSQRLNTFSSRRLACVRSRPRPRAANAWQRKSPFHSALLLASVERLSGAMPPQQLPRWSVKRRQRRVQARPPCGASEEDRSAGRYRR